MKKWIIFVLFCSCGLHVKSQDTLRTPKWTFGTEKGYAQIAGEVDARSGFGLGFFVAKPVLPYLTLRLHLGFGEARGLDEQRSTNWLNHPVWNGTIDNNIDYNVARDNRIFANYRMLYTQVGLEAMVTLTQLSKTYQAKPFDLFVSAGYSLLNYQTKVDARDNFAIYDFFGIDDLGTPTPNQTLDFLSRVMDGNYETNFQENPDWAGLFQIGAGVQWRINSKFSLALSHRLGFANTDLLDSYQWDANNQIDTRNDRMHFTSIGIQYTIQNKPKKPQKIEMPTQLPIRPDTLIVQKPTVIISPPEIPSQTVDLDTKDSLIVNRAFENLEFLTNEDIIQRVSFSSLNELAALLAQHSDWKLKISGHTDNVGDDDFNLDLSRRRAEAVRNYLMAKGLASDRFQVYWYGEAEPIASNNTSEGRQRNRRVELLIVR